MTTAVDRDAYVLGPGEGEALWFADSLLHFKVTGDQTNGQLALAEVRAPRGSSSPSHTHRDEDEAWYVLEGTLTFWLGDDVRVATAGDFVFGPRGVRHRFRVDAEDAHFLIILNPAGFERFARDCGWVATKATFPPDGLPPHSESQLARAAERRGIQITPD